MKVAIYGQYYQHSTGPIIKDIFEFFILKAVDFRIEAKFLATLMEKGLIFDEFPTFHSYTDLDSSFDILISIGGDGTILRAATLVRDLNIPILGINAGRLGFLASVQKDNIDAFLQFVLDKNYTLSPRTLLSLESTQFDPSIEEINFAMNEVVVSRKDSTSMITVETWLNDEYLNAYWADGLIVSTPTGSTGYSLSCGGPILLPDAASLVITPIAPHNLNARPLVIPDNTKVTLKVISREKQFLVSLDSRLATLSTQTELTITKTPFHINMVEIPGETFLKTLRNKLLWGQDKRN